MTDDQLFSLAMNMPKQAKGGALRIYVILRQRGVLTHEWQPVKLSVIQHHTGVSQSRASQFMRWLEKHGHVESIKHPRYSKEYRLPPQQQRTP